MTHAVFDTDARYGFFLQETFSYESKNGVIVIRSHYFSAYSAVYKNYVRYSVFHKSHL